MVIICANIFIVLISNIIQWFSEMVKEYLSTSPSRLASKFFIITYKFRSQLDRATAQTLDSSRSATGPKNATKLEGD